MNVMCGLANYHSNNAREVAVKIALTTLLCVNYTPTFLAPSVSDVMGKNSLEFPDITFLVTFLACSHSRSGRGFGRDNSMELLCVAVSASLSDG